MKPLDFPRLADENIHPQVVSYLRRRDHDIRTLNELASLGISDTQVLQIAYQSGRVVLTHDSDFGRLAVTRREPIFGIVYLRPGHIQSRFTIETLNAIHLMSLDISPPFILVAERSGKRVNIRLRNL